MRRTSASATPSTCFQRTALSSSWMQIALGIVTGSPLESCTTAST